MLSVLKKSRKVLFMAVLLPGFATFAACGGQELDEAATDELGDLAEAARVTFPTNRAFRLQNTATGQCLTRSGDKARLAPCSGAVTQQLLATIAQCSTTAGKPCAENHYRLRFANTNLWLEADNQLWWKNTPYGWTYGYSQNALARPNLDPWPQSWAAKGGLLQTSTWRVGYGYLTALGANQNLVTRPKATITRLSYWRPL